jgi:hypothetical protein
MKIIKRPTLTKVLDMAEVIIKTVRAVAEETKKLKPSKRKEK